jgi:hypothetical protein
MLIVDRLVGMSEEDAIKMIESHEMVARVVSRDGENFTVTAEFKMGRINLDVIDELITAANAG